MTTNYDIVCADIWVTAAALRSAETNGQFPKDQISKFTSGGNIFLEIQKFLTLYAGTGAVYIARDKHKKVYGISLVRVRRIDPSLKQEQVPATEFIRESGGIDEFCARLWTRNSVGGLYRRAKTQYRCRKISAPPADNVAIDPEAGVPKNPKYVERGLESSKLHKDPQAQYQGIYF